MSEHDVYRAVYYVERICSYLQGVNALTDHDLDRMLRVIDGCNHYETSLTTRYPGDCSDPTVSEHQRCMLQERSEL